MKMKALVTRYVTMEVDTVDLDEGCALVQKAVAEDNPDLCWDSKIEVDYPEVLEYTEEEKVWLSIEAKKERGVAA